MVHFFPEPIRNLPEADIPLEGIRAYLSQSSDHQLIFMQFEKDVDLPEHSHATQVGFVLSGRIDLVIEGVKHQYGKGDMYTIPAGMTHSGKIYAGYSDITFFYGTRPLPCQVTMLGPGIGYGNHSFAAPQERALLNNMHSWRRPSLCMATRCVLGNVYRGRDHDPLPDVGRSSE